MPTALELVEHLLGLVALAGDPVALDLAVVGERVHGLLRHRVDGVGHHELGDVEGVGVVGVLHPGRRPQRPLRVGARGRELLQRSLGDHLLVRRVGQPGVGDRGLAAQGQRLVGADRLEPLVDLGVDPGDEERRHGEDPAEVEAGVAGLLEPAQVGVHDLAVALDAEDQRHVDADALGDRGRDRRQPLLGGRDLDVDVRPVHGLPQRLGRGDGGLGVVGQVGLDLDRDPAVGLGALVARREHVAAVADVLGGELEDHLGDVGAVGDQLAHLVVVPLAVRRSRAAKIVGLVVTPTTCLSLIEVGEVAGLDPLPGEVVEPDGDARVG